MATPELHTSTAEIHRSVPVTARPRSHADLIRSFNGGLAELTSAGVLTTDAPAARKWFCNGALVAQFGPYTDQYGREQVCLYFGSWLCLAMSLKVTHTETRAALMAVLKRHPLY